MHLRQVIQVAISNEDDRVYKNPARPSPYLLSEKTTRGGNSLDKKIMLVSVTEQEIFVGKTLVSVKELFWTFLLQNASLVVLQIWLLSKLTCTGKHKAKIHKDT